MTTNQTIDGVPRELLERLLYDLPNERTKGELRALLDAPATEERGSSHGFGQSPNTCRHDERSGVWWREGSITRTGRECCACGSVEEDPVEPAAQPQGEPVAWASNRGGVLELFNTVAEAEDDLCEWRKNAPSHDVSSGPIPLYAEQPAPVAVAQKYDETLLPFLALMRRELHANASKGDRPGWLAMHAETCLLEIFYHLGKLQKAVKKGDGDGMAEFAADVANMCMMLLDICGALHLSTTAKPEACKTCNGSKLVDDGELTHSKFGFPYENGPIKCVKDCPDCSAQEAKP